MKRKTNWSFVTVVAVVGILLGVYSPYLTAQWDSGGLISPADSLSLTNILKVDTLDDYSDGVITIKDDVVMNLTLGVTGVLTASNKIAVDTITIAADAQVTFQDDVTFDSTVTITIDNIVKESVKTDTLEDYGDGWITVQNALVLNGVDLTIVDGTGADSIQITDDGSNAVFDGNNPILIKVGGNTEVTIGGLDNTIADSTRFSNDVTVGVDLTVTGNTTLTDSVYIADDVRVVLAATEEILIDASSANRTEEAGVMQIQLTPGADGTDAIAIRVDMNDFPQTRAMHILFDATNLAAAELASGIVIDVDLENASAGEVHGFQVDATGTGGGVAVTGLGVSAGVDVIHQHSGSAMDMDTAFVWDGAASYTPVDTFLITGISDTTLFNVDNEYLIIGHSTTFDEIEVILSTTASVSIQPTFEYSEGAGSWALFSPEDGTGGFRNNGLISWTAADLTGWATDTVNGVASKYWIRIKRQRNNLVTIPEEYLFQIVAATLYKWDADADLTVNSIDLAGKVTVDTLEESGDGAISVKSTLQMADGTDVDAHTVATDTLDQGGDGAIYVRSDLNIWDGDALDANKVTVDTLGDSGDGEIWIANDVEIASGSGLIVDDSTLVVTGAGKVGIGTSLIPHVPGGFGVAMLALEGADASTAGPHVQFTTVSDNHPLMQIMNWNHDFLGFYFDGYYTGTGNKSSDAGSSFRMLKNGDCFFIGAEYGVAAGASATYDERFSISSTETVLNESGIDVNLRVEANTGIGDMLVGDAGTGTVDIAHKLTVDTLDDSGDGMITIQAGMALEPRALAAGDSALGNMYVSSADTNLYIWAVNATGVLGWQQVTGN